MLTLMFITFVYTSVLRNRDLKILQATAQRWMIKGQGGISYKIVFCPKSKKKNLSVDVVWINQKPYKTTVAENYLGSDVQKEYSENVLSIELTDTSEKNNSKGEPADTLPTELPVKKGDAVIVYTIGKKTRYHIIEHLQQLPFLMSN